MLALSNIIIIAQPCQKSSQEDTDCHQAVKKEVRCRTSFLRPNHFVDLLLVKSDNNLPVDVDYRNSSLTGSLDHFDGFLGVSGYIDIFESDVFGGQIVFLPWYTTGM